MSNICTNTMYLENKVTGEMQSVPCGMCINCRLAKACDWAIRCTHEAQMHAKNVFVTLTYAPEHLPKDHSISKKTFKKFIKRVRNWMHPEELRFYGCG